MSSIKKIKRFIKNASIQSNPEINQKVLGELLNKLPETKQQKTTLNIWKIIMKSPVTKIAVAAAILIGLLIFFIHLKGSQNFQNNDDIRIVAPDYNNNRIEFPDFEQQIAKDLILAKQLFDSNDISGLANLLSSEFEAVRFQAAKYLGQIGDESVLVQLQILAKKWDGAEQDNVFEKAILAIQQRMDKHVSESEAEQEPREVTNAQVSDESEKTPQYIQTGITGIVIDKNTLEPIQGASLTFDREKFVHSDQNGEYELIIPVPWSEIPIDYSPEVPVHVIAIGYTSQRIVVHVEKDKMKEVTIELSPGSKLIGKVIDPNNKPIQGAEVCVLEYTTSIPVTTDANGNFEIDGVNPAYPSPRINVHHPLYPSVSIDFEPAQIGQSVYKEIVLKPGVIIFGQVTNSKSEPLKGVTVGNTNSPLMWNVKKYETIEDGTYVLDNVDTKELTLWAVHKNYAPFVMRTTINLNQSQRQIDIKLSDASELKGIVLDSLGNPVTGAFVVMHEYNEVINIDNNRYPCKPDGTFIIPNAPKEGKLTLNVFGQGITSKMHEVDFALDEQLITIDKSGRIYGQVIDAATENIIPAFHVRMTASRTGDKAYGYSVTWSEEGHTFNSPEGHFDTGRQDLPIGKQYRITVSAEGYDPITNDLVPVQPISDNPERTKFLLRPATLRIGRVVTVDNQPVEGAEIVFYPNENTNNETTLLQATTDEDGIYSIFELGVEFQIIEVNAPGYTPNTYLLEDITRSDGRLEDMILDLGAGLYGYVLDENGQGIADVIISVYIDPVRTNNVRTRVASVRYAATTDKNGFYQLSIVPSGKLLIYAVTVNQQYYHRKKIEIAPGQNVQLNFGDEEGFIISGITRAGEKPLGKAVIYLLSTEGEVLKRTIADTQGRFKLYYVEQDSYKLRAAWSSKNSNEPENWPEGTYFEIDRDLQVDRELDFDIDMQADIVRDTKTGEIIDVAEIVEGS